MLESILVPIDGSALSQRALAPAVAFARASGGTVTLIRAVPPRRTGVSDPQSLQTGEIHEAEADLESIAAPLRDSGLVVQTHVYYETAAEAILAAMRQHHATLVVMSTHGRTGIGRVIYGSVTDHVLRHAHTPLLVVPANARQSIVENAPLRIVVPLDGSPFAETAIPTAIALLDRFGGQLLLLQVIPLPDSVFDVLSGAYAIFNPDSEAVESREYLNRVAEPLRVGNRSVSVESVVGNPAATIGGVAYSHKADLIVMASHGRGGFNRLMLGSVASGVLQHSPVPVIVTRPESSED